MATIRVGRLHGLSHREARQLAERLAIDLERRLGVAWRWDGDVVHFERAGASGLMHVGAAEITVEVRLGLLLNPLRASIEKQIHTELDKLTATGPGA